MGLDLLEPAAEAAIVDLDLRSVRFRHPLIRSAVRQSASLLRRRRVHEALAEVLRAEPERRVWHRAALISGTHEEIADELEEAAGRARRRGALAVAVAALQRAAELSLPRQRARRLLAAAQLAFELGQCDLIMPILREVEQLDPDPIERARATWIEEVVHTRPLGDASRAASLIAAAERAGQAAHHPIVACWLIGDLAEAALHTGRISEARARVKQVEAASGDIPGTCIAVGLLHARATRTGPRGSRGPLRRGARRRPHSLAASACSAVACPRPMAAASAPDRRIAGAAAGRP